MGILLAPKFIVDQHDTCKILDFQVSHLVKIDFAHLVQCFWYQAPEVISFILADYENLFIENEKESGV